MENEFLSTEEPLLFTEAVYPDALPYMKTMLRAITLPRGELSGRGNICYLYTHNIKESEAMINNKENFIGSTFYHWYFYNLIYKGKLYGKVFNFKSIETRKNIYARIEENTKLTAYRRPYIANTETRNMYFELYPYLDLFNKICGKLLPKKQLDIFWHYMKGIISSNTTSQYKSKFILVNIDNFELKTKIKDNLSNPLFALYYTLYKYPEMLKDFNIDWYFYTGKKCLKVNASQMTDKMSYRLLQIEMKRIYKSANTHSLIDDIVDEEKIEQEFSVQDAVENVVNKITTPIDKSGIETNPDKIKNESIFSNDDIVKRVTAKAEKIHKEMEVSKQQPITKEEKEKMVQDKLEAEINNDKKLLEDVYNKTIAVKAPSSSKSTARDELLRKEQKDIKIGKLTIGEIEKINVSNVQIPTKTVSNLKTINQNIKNIKFNNFDKTYNEKVMPKDITNAILALNNKSIPMFVIKIDIKDTSDELNYKDTYTIYLEDENRQRHTVKVDIPKFVEDKFLYLGGNKKIIKNQEFLYPVVKTGPDTVQIVSNYNKMFIRRADNKSISSVERFKRVFNSNPDLRKKFKVGNAYVANSQHITTIEYDELSRVFTMYTNGSMKLFFDQVDAKAYAKEHNISTPVNKMFIGLDKSGNNIFIDINSQKTKDNKYIIDLLLDDMDEKYVSQFESIKSPKRLMYTKVVVMEKEVAVALLICFWETFTKVLEKAKVKYRLENKIPEKLAANESFIKFSDCVLVYDETVPNALLLNGIRLIDTSLYTINDMDTEIPYMNYFLKVYGKANIGNALQNFYEFFIDPITLEVLTDINLPTDICSLVIYAVSLLADSQYVNESDQHVSRVRRNEIVPGILYEALAKAYVQFRNSNGKKKYSVKQDIVIKNLVGLKTVEEYSTLNPSLELKMNHSVSAKGFRGANVDRAYTMNKRAYHKSMVGVISASSSPDGSVGVARTLTLEPTITSVRGYVDIYNDGKMDKLKDVNLFSPVELSMPMAATRDDPTRLGHAEKQSSHVIPVKKSSPVLISNGLEEVARFHLSSDFVVNADEDGTVIDYNDENKIMIVEYKSGKHRAVDLSGTIVKNGGGGFFLSNILITQLKVGDKFKKDDVLAYHKDFFTNSKFNNCRMNMGTMSKVAIMSTYNTYEDATVITNKLSEEAATEMCFQRQVIIGKNSNVEYMVKIGDHITIGDSVIQFDTSYEDNELNELLSRIGEGEDKENLLSDSRNNIHAKHSGVIEDIKMYSPVPLEELSPSLRKIFSDYYKKINRKKAFLEKYDPESKDTIVKCGLLCTETSHEINPNKFGVIKGQKVQDDSVLIEFYVKHSEPLEIGSKIA